MVVIATSMRLFDTLYQQVVFHDWYLEGYAVMLKMAGCQSELATFKRVSSSSSSMQHYGCDCDTESYVSDSLSENGLTDVFASESDGEESLDKTLIDTEDQGHNDSQQTHDDENEAKSDIVRGVASPSSQVLQTSVSEDTSSHELKVLSGVLVTDSSSAGSGVETADTERQQVDNDEH